MKKLFKIISLLLFICSCVYVLDIYSGFKLSTTLENIVNPPVQITEEDTENNSDIQSLNTIMYNNLNGEQKKMYDTIYTALSNHRARAFLKNSQSSDEAFMLVKLVTGDHPELFYFSGSCSYSAGLLEFVYDYSKQEADEIQRQIDKTVEEILPEFMSKGTDYEKSLAAFEWIISNTTYDSDNLDNVGDIYSLSNLEGVFVTRKAVCGGYARAYQYLLKMMNIPAVFISGDATTNGVTERHAWICQQLGGEYYFSDPTWCDAYEKQISKEFISHTYFCINSSQLEKSHKCDDIYDIIKTDATKYNYFYHEGYAFDTYSTTDIRSAVKKSVGDNTAGFEIYIKNDDEFKKATQNLADGYDIYIIMKSVDPLSAKIDTDNISYSINDRQNVIMIAYKQKNK